MHSFQLGQFLIEPSKGTISNEHNSVKIEPKAMAVLCELLKNQGEVVSQQALFEQVWPNRIYSPSSLQRTIAIIRKALNESSNKPTYLFTHPKLGYRLETLDKTATLTPRPKSHHKKLSSRDILILFTLLFVVITVGLATFTQPQKITFPTFKPITFGQHAEFNGKLSSNGQQLAFQSESKANSLFISQVDNPSNSVKIDLNNLVVDFVWRDDDLLALTQDSDSLFSLRQVDINNHNEKLVAELPQWSSISDLVLTDNSSLWFIGRSKSNRNHYLVRHDLVLNSDTLFNNFSAPIINVALASSPNGVYFHFYSNKQVSFGLINNSDDTIKFNVDIPEISDIHWHKESNSLLVSNLMTPELYTFQQGRLSLVDLPLKGVLNDIFSNENTLIATQSRTDMDIIQWVDGKQSKLVDSKYSDYQATLNSKQEMAFLSSRNGRPQVFVQNENQTRLAFDNPENIQLFSPLVWSPNDNILAFVANSKLRLLNIKAGNLTTVDTLNDVERIMSWSVSNKLLLKKSGERYTELNLTTQQSTPVTYHHSNAANSTSKNIIFAAKDTKGGNIEINDEGIYWGESYLPFFDNVEYAFFKNGYLVVHSYDSMNYKLSIFTAGLELVLSKILDSSCLHLTDVDLSNIKQIRWLCTKLEAADSEIMLIDNFTI